MLVYPDGIEKKSADITINDVLYCLDKHRKPENEDPLHKCICSYNTKFIMTSRFFKWPISDNKSWYF